MRTNNVAIVIGEAVVEGIFSDQYFGPLLVSLMENLVLAGYNATLVVENILDREGHSVRSRFDGFFDASSGLHPPIITQPY